MGTQTTTSPDNHGMVLKKHVALIHCSGSLTFLQRKAFNVLNLHAYDTLLTQRVHSIPIAALAELSGFDSKNLAYLQDAVTALQSTVVRFALLDPKFLGNGTQAIDPKRPKGRRRSTASDGSGDPWLAQGPLLSWAEVKGDKFEFSFIEQLAKKMHHPEVFGVIDVTINRNITSGYTLSMYENIARYRGIGYTSLKDYWSIELFRELVGATAPAYDDFRKLRTKVIEVGLKEINAHSDIFITPEYRHGQGRGRPVTGIRFKVEANPQLSLLSMQEDPAAPVRDSAAVKRLIALGVSERLAVAAASREPGWAMQIAEIVESKQRDGSIRKSTAALASALIQRQAGLGSDERTQDAPTSPAAPRTVASTSKDSPSGPDDSAALANYLSAVEHLGPAGTEAFHRQYLDRLRKAGSPDLKAWDSQRSRWIGAWPEHRYQLALIDFQRRMSGDTPAKS